MTQSPQPPAATEHQIVVPVSISLVSLLGSGDEYLRVVEAEFPGTDIHVRGNEINLTGPVGEVALVERLFDELIVVLRTGVSLSRLHVGLESLVVGDASSSSVPAAPEAGQDLRKSVS